MSSSSGTISDIPIPSPKALNFESPISLPSVPPVLTLVPYGFHFVEHGQKIFNGEIAEEEGMEVMITPNPCSNPVGLLNSEIPSSPKTPTSKLQSPLSACEPLNISPNSTMSTPRAEPEEQVPGCGQTTEVENTEEVHQDNQTEVVEETEIVGEESSSKGNLEAVTEVQSCEKPTLAVSQDLGSSPLPSRSVSGDLESMEFGAKSSEMEKEDNEDVPLFKLMKDVYKRVDSASTKSKGAKKRKGSVPKSKIAKAKKKMTSLQEELKKLDDQYKGNGAVSGVTKKRRVFLKKNFEEPSSSVPTAASRSTRSKKKALEQEQLEVSAKKGRMKVTVPENVENVVISEESGDAVAEGEQGSKNKAAPSEPIKRKGLRSSSQKKAGEPNSSAQKKAEEPSSSGGKSKKRSIAKKKKKAELDDDYEDAEALQPIPEDMTREQDFNTRKVLKGKVPRDLHLDPMHKLMAKLEFQGWKRCIRDIRGASARDSIHEFYKNLVVNEDHVLSTVNGVTVTISEHVLGEILGVPAEGYSDYKKGGSPSLDGIKSAIELSHKFTGDEEENERASVHKTEMTPFQRLIFEFNRCVILPRGERRAIANMMDIVLLELVEEEIPMNWPAIMIAHMKYVAFDANRHSLPYGFLLTQVLKQLRVSTSVASTQNKHDIFGAEVVVNCGFTVPEGPRPRNSQMRRLEDALKQKEEEVQALKNQVLSLQREQEIDKKEIAQLREDLRKEIDETRSAFERALANLIPAGPSSSSAPPFT